MASHVSRTHRSRSWCHASRARAKMNSAGYLLAVITMAEGLDGQHRPVQHQL